MTALPNPLLLSPSHSTPWREEQATHSMRSLAYFIGTFVVALMLGIGSAWYMIERGSPLTTTKVGPWAGWISEGNPNADPYTEAHVARSGRLPLSSTVARYFTARTDSGGHTLTSACQYLIVGSPLNARWWSLAVYDEYGGLIENPSGRYSFNDRGTAAPRRRQLPHQPVVQSAPRELAAERRRRTAPGADVTHLQSARNRCIWRRPDSRRTPAKDRAQRMRVRLPGLYIVLGLVLAGLIHIVAVLTLAHACASQRPGPAGGARARQHDDRTAAGSLRAARPCR